MQALDLIRKKHAGGELLPVEIDWLVRAAVAKEIPDYQLGALLMAINYEHLTFDETTALTRAFVASGETLSWPSELGTFTDKHSTGGVGDKVSLILLPLLVSLGFKVAKMSGRSLGFTGGTIDKLESIPGFRTKLSREEMLRIVSEVGCCIVEQSANLVPADKVFYALRDATDTVEEMGLIAASVMSKKIACGAPFIVLDVKCGSGAFFKTLARAREFATLAKRIGSEFGRKVGCVITSMEQPLGDAIGTAVEVSEAERLMRLCQKAEQLRISEGKTPWAPPLGRLNDLYEVVVALASCAQAIAGKVSNLGQGKLNAAHELESGKPHEIFLGWIAAQGGRWQEFEQTLGATSQDSEDDEKWPYYSHWVTTDQQGYLQRIDTAALGSILARLGAGRMEQGLAVRHDINFDLCCRVGDKIDGDGAVLLDIMMREDPTVLLEEDIRQAFVIGDKPPDMVPVVLETLL